MITNMKRKLLSVSAIILVLLSGCKKESGLDTATASSEDSQIPITFTTYASMSATKGTAVSSNTDFQEDVGSFDVAAITADCTYELIYATEGGNSEYIDYTMYPVQEEAVSYFGFNQVTYTDNVWSSFYNMYWPNSSKIITFAACSPSGLITSNDSNYEFTYEATTKSGVTYDDDSGYNSEDDYTVDYNFSFYYTVESDVSDQIDLMYALTSVNYLAPSDRIKDNGAGSYITTGVYGTNDEDAVNLHFKHALTQIAFTAIKEAGITVTVKGLTLCNVYNSGTFTATAVTDDDEADAEDNPTIGDGDGDQVNANNFGSWVANYEGFWTLYTTGDGSTSTETFKANSDDSMTGGYYAATDGGGYSAMSNYTTTLELEEGEESITIGSETTATQLTSLTDVLMLMPQTLTAWVPTTSTELNYVGSYATTSSSDGVSHADGGLSDGEFANPSMNSSKRTLSYLAIDCVICHTGSTEPIHDGLIFVPFSTADLDYSTADVDDPIEETQDAWLPGYKITYCLNFGGGYVVEEGNHTTIPEPGCIPDTETYTLRTITYTATVDTFVEVDADEIDLDYYDTSL